jgi:hypothetical protein
MHKGGLTTRNKQRTTLPRRVVILIDIQESEKPSVKYVFCQEWRNCNMWPLRHFGSWCTVMEKEFSDKHRVTDVEGTIASWALWRDVPILYEQSAFPEVARLVFCRWP